MKRWPVLLDLVPLAYAVAGFWFIFSHDVVFSGDVGLKLLQAASLARGEGWLRYDGADLDPAWRLFPFLRRSCPCTRGTSTPYT